MSDRPIPLDSDQPAPNLSNGMAWLLDQTSNFPKNKSQSGTSSQAPVADQGFVEATAHSFAYNLVQSPLEGVTQLFDNTIGSKYETNLYGKVKDALVTAPAPAAFGTAEWHGQQIGGALAAVPWFLAARGSVRGVGGCTSLTRGLVVESAEAMANKTVFSATGAKLALEGGLTGAAYAGVLKPVDTQGTTFGTAKLKSMATDFATFGTLTASSLYFNESLGKAVAPLIKELPQASGLIGRATSGMSGLLSGIPAGFVDSEAHYVMSGMKDRPTFAELTQNIYAYGVIGAGMNVATPHMAKAAGRSELEVYRGKLEPTPEPLPEAQAGQPRKGHIEVEEGSSSQIRSTLKAPAVDIDVFAIPAKAGNGGTSTTFGQLLLDSLMHETPSPLPSHSTLDMMKLHSSGDILPASKNSFTFDPEEIEKLLSFSDKISGLNPGKDFNKLPNAYEFRDHILDNKIGQYPEPFLDTGLTRGDTFEKLDALAKALRSLDVALPAGKKSGLGTTELEMPPLNISLGEKTAQLTKIGIGEVSHVYKLSLGGHDYALKVTSDPARMDIHGSYAETAAFTYLTKYKISDLIDFHAANPSASGGWILTEYVDKPVAREGEPLAQMLAREGMVLGDDRSVNRGPGNVVWDLGGIEPADVTPVKSLDELRELLGTEAGRRIAGRKLDGISDQGELKKALLSCLWYDPIAGQVPRSAGRLTSKADLAEVLSAALDKKGAAGRAAFELDRLANSPHMKDVFYKALSGRESRIEAAKMIDRLPFEERQAAFKYAMQFPEARAMAARSIPSLPEDVRPAAVELAKEYPGSAYVVYQELFRTRDLTESEKAARESALHHYLQSYGIEDGYKAIGAKSNLTFDDWLSQSRAEDPQSPLKNNNNQSVIREIWPRLTDLQKEMPVNDLLRLGKEWHSIDTNHWKTMTPEEIGRFLEVSPSYGLTGSGKQALLDSPDIYPWLKENSGLEQADINAVILHWQEIPVNFRHLPAHELSSIASAIGFLDRGDWAKIAPENAGTIAKALDHLPFLGMDSKKVASLPDFAKWFVDNKQEMNFHTRVAMSLVIDAWPNLTPEEKQLAPVQLVARAEQHLAMEKLHATFGDQSKVLSHIATLGGDRDPVAASVQTWLKNITAMDPNKKQLAMNMLEALGQQGAVASEFTREALNMRFNLDNHFGDQPALRARLEKVLSGAERADDLYTVLSLLPNGDERNIKLMEEALDNGFKCSPEEIKRFRNAATLGRDLNLAPSAMGHLYQLAGEPSRLYILSDFLAEQLGFKKRVKELIESNASWKEIEPKTLLDDSYLDRLTVLNEAQLGQVRRLRTQGLSIGRLYSFIEEAPGQAENIKIMLDRKAGMREVNNLMRLSVFPDHVALKLTEADSQGLIRAEDVIGKTRDWQSGPFFRSLLIGHVDAGAPLSPDALQRLEAGAIKAAESGSHARTSPVRTHSDEAYDPASAFVEAADQIVKTVPEDKTVVLLGRDAWPLVPLLRARGRDAQYFMWSRLQNSDQATHRQWLKEVPPNAAVVDTGYSGSIINVIKEIDPSVTGYLMHSATENYPSLLHTDESRSQVAQIELLPKLIYRSHKYTENGGAVSRRKPISRDSDHTRSFEELSRWNVERRSRELLMAAGLPTWDVWRYSQYVGLTPQERLGLNNRQQVEQHYQMVEDLRQHSILSQQ